MNGLGGLNKSPEGVVIGDHLAVVRGKGGDLGHDVLVQIAQALELECQLDDNLHKRAA